MVSFRKNTRKRVSFRGENNEKIASEPEEDASQAVAYSAENLAQTSQGSFLIYALIIKINLIFWPYCGERWKNPILSLKIGRITLFTPKVSTLNSKV